jgi:DNA-binding IclR family transcriptional regulator
MFARDRQEIGIGEIAQELGLHRSTTSRPAATLAVAGYQGAAGEPGRYRLSGRLAAMVAAGGDVRQERLRPDRDGGGEHQHLRARLTHR